MTMPRTIVARTSALFVIALIAITAIPAAIAAAPSAAIRFVQASPDGRTVDVYLDGTRVAGTAQLGEATAFLPIELGKRKMQIIPSGGDLSTAYSIDMQIEPNNLYTVAAIGRSPELKLTAIVERPYTPPAGKAALHVYHFSPDAPAVDVKTAMGDVLVSNLSFPFSSGYREIAAGTYDLRMFPAAVNLPILNCAQVDKACMPSHIQAEAGQLYSVFIVDPLTKQSQINIKIATDMPPTLVRPKELPNTAGQNSLAAQFSVIAVLLLLCGLMLRQRTRA